MAARGGGGAGSGSALQVLHHLDAELSSFLSDGTSIWSSSANSARFLRTVDRLLAVLASSSSSSSSSSAAATFAAALLNKTMSRLSDEFSLLLLDEDPAAATDDVYANHDLDDDIPVARPIQDYNVVIDALSRSTIHDLASIARRMAAAGYWKDCAEVYAFSRKEFVDESVSRVGIRRQTAEDVAAMNVRELELEIQRWNQGVKVVFLVLFPSEKRLADRVFAGVSSNLGFLDACGDAARWILGFVEAVAARSRQPELLFKVVDMYEVLRDLMPEIYLLFSSGRGRFLADGYRKCLEKLGEAVRGTFTDLEKMIRGDPVRIAIAGGTVHPITRYVINYLHATTAAWRTFEEIMEETDHPAGVAVVVAEEDEKPKQTSSFSAQVGWMIERLNTNLEAKSKAYANESLGFVFLMNNARYMLEKLGGSEELKYMLGDEWISGQEARIRHWQAAYQRRSWSKVIAAAQIGSSGGVGSVTVMKHKLKLFNTYLEEVCREHRGWMLNDDRLREDTRAAVVSAVVPTYRSLLERGRRELRRDISSYLKYSPDQVEALIRSELFVPPPPKKKK